MGISGLLPFLKKASQGAHLKDFYGQTAAVDAYCWLHKGAFSCADKLVKGESTNGYVIYVMKQVSLLLSYGIKPIMVFDGCHLPSKAVTETKRRENREKNRKQAKELLRQGRTREAREHFQRCVEVTSAMAFEVISACRARNVDVIVAPYEADAQLAFLNQCGLAHVVITEDSDLVVFGCKAVLFKMDNNGGCVYVDREKLHLAMNVPRDKFSFEKFRNMAILSGCDYLPSLSGIGLAKAHKFFNVTANTDTYNVLCRLPSYLNMPNLDVPQEYREKFLQAVNTFLYQLVFDPTTQTLRPLTEYPANTGPEDYPYAGDFVGHGRARQIALGNVNVQSGKVVDYFDPDTYKPPPTKSTSWESKGATLCTHPSIWSKTPFKRKAEAPDLNLARPATTTSGNKITKPFPRLNTKLKMEPEEKEISEEDLMNLYSQPEKRHKILTASPQPLQCFKEDSNQADAAELSHTTTTPTITSTECEAECSDNVTRTTTPPEAPRRVNPFAKRKLSPKKDTAATQPIRKFNKMKNTGINSSLVVQSRFFTSNAQTPPNNCEPTVQSKVVPADNQTIDVCTKSEEPEAAGSPSPQNTPTNNTCRLSPTRTNFTSTKKSAFNWERFSYVGAGNFKAQRNTSPACARAFKDVTVKDQHPPSPSPPPSPPPPPSPSPPPSSPSPPSPPPPSPPHEPSSVSPGENQDQQMVAKCSLTSSQASVCSGVDSIDNESFGLTPSLPSSTESCEVTPLKDTTNCLTESSFLQSSKNTPESIIVVGKNPCRAPGLSRRNSKKKEPGKRQLSLMDMFSYKRDGRKLPFPPPV